MSPGVDCSPGLSSQIPNPHSETGNPPEGWESEGQTPNPKHQSSGCLKVSGKTDRESETVSGNWPITKAKMRDIYS